MARIQHPQNEKGINLATVDELSDAIDTLIKEQVGPIKEKLDKGFETITSEDQFININKDSDENNIIENIISLKVTEDINDINSASENNNKLVTSKVLKDVVNDSTGLTIKHDIDSDYKITDESEDVGDDIRCINFFGEYVNVVKNDDNTINLYFGKNNNNPSFSSITDTFGNPNYVYTYSDNRYQLPPDAEVGESYPRTSSLNESEEIKLNNGNLIGGILEDQTIIITIESNRGTITYETSKISEKAAIVNDYTWEDTTNGITVEATSLIKYTKDDAKNGFTPNSTSGKFVVTVINEKIVGDNGGWYNVSIQLGKEKQTTKNIFVYPFASVTPKIDTPVITYTSTGVKFISGLEYDFAGIFTLTVDNIEHTQQATTKDLNRLQITKAGGDVNFSEIVTTTTQGMSVKNEATTENAVYKYLKTYPATSTIAKKVSAVVKAQAYGQLGEPASEEKTGGITSSSWLYTDNNDDTDLITYFQQDGRRVFNTLDNIKNAIDDIVYDSKKSLLTDYNSQLLVQDGKLKYPSDDSTGRYSDITGTRYYVRPIKFGGSEQINNISVIVSDLDTFNNDKMRMYIVKKGNKNAQVLNWFKADTSCPYGIPIADKIAPSSNKWTCTINNDVFQLKGGEENMYYLVIEMVEMNKENAISLGQIILA